MEHLHDYVNAIVVIAVFVGTAVLAHIKRQQSIIHQRFEKRDAIMAKLDDRLDTIENRLIRIETLLEERQK